MRLKTAVQGLGLALAGLLACLLLLELLLRLLPVCQPPRALPVDEANPVLRFEPNADLDWSRHADFSLRNRVHVNNAGFISNQDYDAGAPGPLLAVVGDSYVEALMVPWERTLHGRLAGAFEGRARVYSFGVSGAALSQYLAFARFARDVYRPSKALVLVVGNDFDESLPQYKSAPGLHVFGRDGRGEPVLLRAGYQPSSLGRLALRSRLFLYLVHNLAVQGLPGQLRSLLAAPQPFVGQTAAKADAQRLADGRWAVDAFLALLPEAFGLPGQDIVLLVDAPRPEIYDPAALAQASDSYFVRMRDYLLLRARQSGVGVLDLAGPMGQDFAARGRRFEFPKDGHWSEEGHGLAARAVLESGLLGAWPGEGPSEAKGSRPVRD